MVPTQQAPGQAPTAALPGMLAQQRGVTPPPQIEQLAQLPVEQLKQMFFQTMQSDTGVQPLTVLAAIKQASEKQRMQQALQGQMAQQQAAQQPGTVRDEILAQAQAAPGGIQALASGGAVQSFEDGGPSSPAGRFFSGVSQSVNKSLDEQRELEKLRLAIREKYARSASPFGLFMPQSDADRARAVQVMQSLPKMSREEMQALLEGAAPAAVPSFRPSQNYEPPSTPATAAPPAPAAPAAPPAPSASAAPSVPAARAAGASGGLDTLIARYAAKVGTPNPELDAIRKQLEANARERGETLRGMQGLSPEEAAARKQFYETVQGVYEPQRKALEEARGATRQSLLSSPEALLRMAAAASGKKRIGEALGAAAGSAGEVLGERRKRAEQLEANYQTLKSQLALTMAQAQRADVEGDEKRKRELLLQAQAIKDSLVQSQTELVKIAAESDARNLTGLASLVTAKAHERQAGAAEARAARDHTAEKQQQNYLRLQQALNSDPRLKAIAEKMKLMPSPQLTAEYEAIEESLIRRHMPELLKNTDVIPPGAVRVKGQ